MGALLAPLLCFACCHGPSSYSSKGHCPSRTNFHETRLILGPVLHSKPLRPLPPLLNVLGGLKRGWTQWWGWQSGSGRRAADAAGGWGSRAGTCVGPTTQRTQRTAPQQASLPRSSSGTPTEASQLTCGGFHSRPEPAGSPKREARCARFALSSSVNRSIPVAKPGLAVGRWVGGWVSRWTCGCWRWRERTRDHSRSRKSDHNRRSGLTVPLFDHSWHPQLHKESCSRYRRPSPTAHRSTLSLRASRSRA